MGPKTLAKKTEAKMVEDASTWDRQDIRDAFMKLKEGLKEKYQ